VLDFRPACALALFAASAALLPPTTARVREFASWFARPATLPFSWRALQEAATAGDAEEAFARGQRIMQLLPQWVEGHCAFAFRYALTEDDSVTAEQAAAAAERRLHVALAQIAQARAFAGDREPDLLQSSALLIDIACRRFEGLAERLQARGGAMVLADRYLAEAERLFPSAALREQRTFRTPLLAAALLQAGRTRDAIDVLRAAIDRAAEVRDRQLATEWAARLQEAIGWLSGDRTVDRTEIFADRRLAPLWPHLR